MNRLAKEGLLEPLLYTDLIICEYCLSRKANRKHFGEAIKLHSSLKLIYFDICEPMNIRARHSTHYLITFINNITRYNIVCLILHRFKALYCFKPFQQMT